MSLKVKILLLLFLSAFPLNVNASFLYSAKNICIEDYFTDADNKKFCYLISTTNSWNCITTKKQQQYIYPNYVFDNNTWYCKPNTALYYGLEQSQFNFLLALSGLLMGLIILLTSIYLVLNVGGKK